MAKAPKPRLKKPPTIRNLTKSAFLKGLSKAPDPLVLSKGRANVPTFRQAILALRRGPSGPSGPSAPPH
jgi:hypothetical protein